MLARRRRRPRALLSLLGLPATLLIALSTPAPALAAPGDLDPAFGTDGKVEQWFDDDEGLMSRGAMAAGPDGSAIVAAIPPGGGLWLARYTATGTLDGAFGSGGLVVDPDAPGSIVYGALTTDAAGRILVAGNGTDASAELGVSVRRFLPNGTPDASFGDAGEAWIDDPTIQPAAIDLDGDGRIVVFADGFANVTFLRLTADGDLDPTFDDDGVARFAAGESTGSDSVSVNDGLVQPDGKLVATGSAYLLGPARARQVVVRMLPDGSPDPDFGADGEELNDAAGMGVGIVRQPDGKLVVASGWAADTGDPYDGYEPYDPGYGAANFVLTRYGADGGVDPTFGAGGDAWVMPGIGGRGGAEGLLRQADGRLVAYGTAERTGGYGFTLARFEAGGRLDTGFGDGGVAHTPWRLGMAYGGVQATDGDLVLSGRAVVGMTDVLGVARYDAGAATTPDPGPSDGGSAGGGAGGGGPAASGGGSGGGGGGDPAPRPVPDQPGGPAPAPPVGPIGPITVIDTTTVRRMPTVTGLRVDRARDRVTEAGIRADFELVEVHRRPSAKHDIGDVVAQSPSSGTRLTSSVAEQPRVRLEVYAGPEPKRGADRSCPVGALARDLRGANLDVADALLDRQGVRTTTDVKIRAGADEARVTGIDRDGRCSAEVEVKAPKRPDAADVFVVVREHPTEMSFQEDDWALTAGERNAYFVQVLDRTGALVQGAEVLVDNTGVGAAPKFENQVKRTDDGGQAAFSTPTPSAGTIDILVRVPGANDVELWGTAQLRVADRSGERCVETVTGLTYRRVKGGFASEPTRAGCGGAAARQAGGGWNLFAWVHELVFGAPPARPVAKREAKAELAELAEGPKVVPAQLALGQPIGPPRAKVDVIQGEVHVVSAGSGNVISAGGGNVISAGSGNVVVAAAPRVISAGGGNVISAGGGNVISAGGGNVISAGGGNIISRDGASLVPGRGGAIAFQPSGLIGGAGGNLIGGAGGNLIGGAGGN